MSHCSCITVVCGSANGKEFKYNKPELHWGFLRSVTTRKDLQAAVPHLKIEKGL